MIVLSFIRVLFVGKAGLPKHNCGQVVTVWVLTEKTSDIFNT